MVFETKNQKYNNISSYQSLLCKYYEGLLFLGQVLYKDIKIALVLFAFGNITHFWNLWC